MKIRYCECGKPLPSICRVKGLCNYCASKIKKKATVHVQTAKSRIKRNQAITEFKTFVFDIWSERIQKFGRVICEECGKELGDTPTGFCVSHIISKGARPDLYFDKRNINILCPDHHRQWEFGIRENMRIFARNQLTITELKNGSIG